MRKAASFAFLIQSCIINPMGLRWLPEVSTALWAACLLILLNMGVSVGEGKCHFKAIFNFGDSNSDTGGFYSAFPAQTAPFGMTHFGKPTGRASDGRLIVDFLAEALGIPYVSPYLQSIGSNFQHGANYATLASTVLLPKTSLFVSGLSPFSLAIQLNQMKDFKARVLPPHHISKLPGPDIFGRSLYTLDIGQNDFTSNLSAGIASVKQFLPQVIAQIADTVKELYMEGGRWFLVFNLRPVGCYPAFLAQLPHQAADLDEFGCVISYNAAVSDYNNMLREKLQETGALLPNASLIYVDIHSVMLELFRRPTFHGLLHGTKACCGYGGEPYNFKKDVYCGNSKEINGTVERGAACSDPDKYVSWDGIHATEAANKLVTQAILSGFYFDPPFPISKLCDLHPIG